MVDFEKNIKKHNILAPKKIVELLNLNNKKNIIDCTFGVGGHSMEILNTYPDINLFCVDFDKKNLLTYGSCIKNKAIFIHDNFINIAKISNFYKIKFDSILIDLGFHQEQIFNPKYGLSYINDQPLNMLVDDTVSNKKTATYYINNLSASELSDIFFLFGEERHSKKIAQRIIEERRRNYIKTTGELVNIIKQCVFSHLNSSCARIFQALRMYVNNEISNLTNFLKEVCEAASSNCTLVTLSFHSVEDRIIKNFMMKRPLNFNCENIFKYASTLNSNYKNNNVEKISKIVMKNSEFTNRKSMPFIIRSANLNV